MGLEPIAFYLVAQRQLDGEEAAGRTSRAGHARRDRSYHLNAARNDYVRYGTNQTTGHERARFVQHGDELVDTIAAPLGPDVVGLVETDVTYGAMGDHGGHNRLIQQIPMIFAGPGVGAKDPNGEMRLVDVTPTVIDLTRSTTTPRTSTATP